MLDGNPQRFGPVRHPHWIEPGGTQKFQVSTERVRIVFDHHDVLVWHHLGRLLACRRIAG